MVWIGAAFLITSAITFFTRIPAISVGCFLPIAAVGFATLYVLFIVAPVATNSTAPVFIPFAGMMTVAGSLPGAVVGEFFRRVRTKRKVSE